MFIISVFGESLSFFFLAFALGLDGFSISLAIGTYKLRLRRIFFIGLLVGFFHMLLPFIGLMIGQVVSIKGTDFAEFLGHTLLMTIGLYIFFSAFQEERKAIILPQGLRLLTIVFFISIDSFPVGLSLGLTGVKTAFFLILFACVTASLSWLGLLIGKKTSALFGVYSEFFAGFLLFVYGFAQLFH